MLPSQLGHHYYSHYYPRKGSGEMKHLLLAYPANWYIDENLSDLIKPSVKSYLEFGEKTGEDDFNYTNLRAYMQEPLREVFTVPFLTKKYCELLLDEVRSMEFIPNSEEDELRQIPEIVLHERMPKIYKALREAVEQVLNPVFFELWQIHIHNIHIQVANYNPRDKRAGAWHHDRSADITVVVPLNTGEYSGGGTEFHGRGVVDPLPTGSALIFPSLTHLHRGLPVTEGDRYLLVFWLKVDHAE
jgi:hypothetical protein